MCVVWHIRTITRYDPRLTAILRIWVCTRIEKEFAHVFSALIRCPVECRPAICTARGRNNVLGVLQHANNYHLVACSLTRILTSDLLFVRPLIGTSAPLCTRRRATSGCPFFRAYVNALSPATATRGKPATHGKSEISY